MDKDMSTEPKPSPPAASILLVAHHEAMRKFFKSFLERRGYSVTEADCGESALEIWKEMTPKPRLLITDLTLSEMNGYSLAGLLRQFQPGIKVLFIGESGIELISETQTHVRNSFRLDRPFAPDLLASTVESVLAKP
jgi:two-component system cell cycle sensor histidine kinase/response regulator CckA